MQINVHEAKAKLSALIKSALAGEEVIIAKAGEPMVKLMPLQAQRKAASKPRVGGQWRGQIWISPDFNDPDPEFERLFYGDDA